MGNGQPIQPTQPSRWLALAPVIVTFVVPTAGAIFLLPTLLWVVIIGGLLILLSILGWRTGPLARWIELENMGRIVSLLVGIVFIVISILTIFAAIPSGIITTANDQVVSANILALLGVVCLIAALPKSVSIGGTSSTLSLPNSIRYLLLIISAVLFIFGMTVFLGIARISTPSTITGSPSPTVIPTWTPSVSLTASLASVTVTPSTMQATVTATASTPFSVATETLTTTPTALTPTITTITTTPTIDRANQVGTFTIVPTLSPLEVSPYATFKAIVKFTGITFTTYLNPAYQIRNRGSATLGDVSWIPNVYAFDPFAQLRPTFGPMVPAVKIPKVNPYEPYVTQEESSTTLHSTQKLVVEVTVRFENDLVRDTNLNFGKVEIFYDSHNAWGRGKHLVNSITREGDGLDEPAHCPNELPRDTSNWYDGCFELSYEIVIVQYP
jgi:hypothetical protein